jgi:hypothetical protein
MQHPGVDERIASHFASKVEHDLSFTPVFFARFAGLRCGELLLIQMGN